MKYRRGFPEQRLAWLTLASVLGAFCPATAQQAHQPTLDEILQKLDANLDRYDSSVPSLFCDEHVVSEVFPAPGHPDAVTDSVFRLKRVPQGASKVALIESREIKTVNGKPPTSENIDGPTILSGAFEGGLALVSLSQRVCMNYSLERPRRKDEKADYVVRFSSVLTPQNSAACLLQENGKGRVWIDPGSMQVTRLELITPRHIIMPASSYQQATTGDRAISVNYAPVQMGGQTFWMPATISSTVTSGRGTFHAIVWSYVASYRNYHKLEVKSRILPSGEALAP